MENQHTQIEVSVIDTNKENRLKDYSNAILALGAMATVVTVLCLGTINTAYELIVMLYE
jgi:hypothetical protein